MKTLSILFGIFFTGAVLVGCSNPEQPAFPTETSTLSPTTPATGTSSPVPTATPAPTSTVPSTPLPTPSPTRDARQVHYQMSADLDYASYRISVTQRITIPNPSSQELTELVLVVPPNFQRDVFRLEEIAWEQKGEIDTYILEGIRLEIPITDAWFPGQSRELLVTYSVSLPIINSLEGFGPSPFGYSNLQVNIVDWYPFVPPYRGGEGWIIHEPWYYGEYLVYPSADYDVSLQIRNAPQQLVVAASAQNDGGEEERRYHLEDGRNFVISVSPHYRVLEEKVGETTVLGYVFPFYEDAGAAAFQTTVEALELFSEMIGPYEQSTLTMVQADFDHGMEYEGLYFLNRSFFNIYNDSPASFLVAIAAHETAHQWWYGDVGSDQALEPWLDEAICTYGELLYFEEYYPEAVEWWWANRVDFYEPQGVIDRSIYETSSYLDYRDSTYLRGAQFWADLREALGDEVLFDFLSAYAARYSGEIATGDGFFALLEEISGSAAEEIIENYFEEIP